MVWVNLPTCCGVTNTCLNAPNICPGVAVPSILYATVIAPALPPYETEETVTCLNGLTFPCAYTTGGFFGERYWAGTVPTQPAEGEVVTADFYFGPCCQSDFCGTTENYSTPPPFWAQFQTGCSGGGNNGSSILYVSELVSCSPFEAYFTVAFTNEGACGFCPGGGCYQCYFSFHVTE